MTEEERGLWVRFREGDETARRALLERYLRQVNVLAAQIARSAGWADWRDLQQDGVIGLMQAMKRFDLSHDGDFPNFARSHIRGAILDGSELTRSLARRQHEFYRQIKAADAELSQSLGRPPTRAEVTEKTGLSEEQMRNALAAVGVAFAAEPVEADTTAVVNKTPAAQLEAAILVREVLTRLDEQEAQIISYYYLEDQSSQEISRRLGLTVSNVTKIRQRALSKLRALFGDEGGSGHDENR